MYVWPVEATFSRKKMIRGGADWTVDANPNYEL